jgi:hypothetical protein
MSEACVVPVRVRDHCPIDFPPRVDVEVAGRAVQALRARDDQRRGCHETVIGWSYPLANGEKADNKNKEEQQQERSLTVSPALAVLGFISIFAAIIGAAIWQHGARTGHQSFIDSYAFPPGVRQRVHKRYPHLTEPDLDLVFDALREYFHLCRKGGRRLLSMPSQVVDVAWHEFILFTRNYQNFCDRALGRFLHHTPAEAMATPTTAGDGIKRTWRLACLRQGIDPKAATVVPLLFAIDGRLGIRDGFNYVLNCTHMLGAGPQRYCASDISAGGCGSCGGGCAGQGCGSDGGGGDGGGCGGGGGD